MQKYFIFQNKYVLLQPNFRQPGDVGYPAVPQAVQFKFNQSATTWHGERPDTSKIK